ncbi:putative signal transducing protein [Albidovulum inexpectatum]|uniref:Putative signal transducing protein n=2 Tax=Albidovulum inexpectatum TaxID=196587 RepID=A0A2S5JGA3_9RHOB|nr:putative signal transducing protein [Albidovulum inexpectatum]
MCRSMKELIRTNDPTVIAYVTALLDAQGIASFQMDVHMSVLEGSIGILPRRLMVADRDLFMARSILRDAGVEMGE